MAINAEQLKVLDMSPEEKFAAAEIAEEMAKEFAKLPAAARQRIFYMVQGAQLIATGEETKTAKTEM